MSTTSHAYANVATLLWMAAALFFALAAIRLLQLPFRQGLFVIVVCVGGVLLLRISRGTASFERPTALPLLPASVNQAPVLTSERKDAVGTVPTEKKLSPPEAREWVDDFLVRQQKKQ